MLERERELGGRDEELAKQRKELPWVAVEKEYTFDTEQGNKTLAELFDGRSQLLIYHLMFGPTYAAACPGCSGLADHFDPALVHLNNRDVTLICISRAPIEKLQAYRRMGGKRGLAKDCVSAQSPNRPRCHPRNRRCSVPRTRQALTAASRFSGLAWWA